MTRTPGRPGTESIRTIQNRSYCGADHSLSAVVVATFDFCLEPRGRSGPSSSLKVVLITLGSTSSVSPSSDPVGHVALIPKDTRTLLANQCSITAAGPFGNLNPKVKSLKWTEYWYIKQYNTDRSSHSKSVWTSTLMQRADPATADDAIGSRFQIDDSIWLQGKVMYRTKNGHNSKASRLSNQGL